MTPALNLHRLEAFVAVTDHGGFSAAARATGTAQSTLSSNLQQLEGELGAVLVDRSARPARLTQAGEALIGYARSLLALADEAADRVARLRSAPVEGVLTVGGTATVTQHILPRLLRSFADRYSGVEIDLHVDNSTAVVDAVAEGRIPLALIASDVDRRSLAVHPIGVEEQVVIVAGDHLLAGQTVDPKELHGSRILLREEGSATRRYQLDLVRTWRIPRARTSTIASNEAIIGAVSHGLGISWLPRVAAEHALRLGLVAPLDLEPAPPERPLTLIRLADRPLSVIEELFLERVREEGTP